MYIKKKDKELFKDLEDKLSMPIYWDEFVLKQKRRNRFIIKEKNVYRCTNCNAIFESKVKINEPCKCPKCQNTYLVKLKRLKQYNFKSDLAILDKYREYYIIRMFRLETTYKNNCYKDYCYEYGRRIYDLQFQIFQEIVNSNVSGNIGGIYISFRESNSTNWRYFRSCCSYLSDSFYYYPNNIREVIKDRESLKYSQLWELVKHVECDLIYLIVNYNPSIEFLTKLNLYNLALCPRFFKNKKSFEERFLGLSKDYLPFFQKYNITLNELETLSILKVKDIDYIKKFKNISRSDLEFLTKYVNLVRLVEKTDFESSSFWEYRDYLKLAIKLKLNLKDKRNLYPQNIKVAHDKLLKEYEQKKNKVLNNSIQERCQNLKKNVFQQGKYIVFPAEDLDSLIDESSQQNNCVRTYAERIANNKCDIYFMRLLTNKNKSLVTVEVKENKIVQKRTKNNEKTTKIQDRFLELWERKILRGENNEKKFN